MVTKWHPLKIWFFEECYVRFSIGDYNEENIFKRE